MPDRLVERPPPELVELAKSVPYWIRFVWRGRLYYQTFQNTIFESAASLVYNNGGKDGGSNDSSNEGSGDQSASG